MMRIHTLLYTLPLALLCGGCSWFDVGSKSEVGEEEMFASAEGYYTALTGIYAGMGDTRLYGGNLPLYALEPLTQQYTVSDDKPDRVAWAKYNYLTDGGRSLADGIWSAMYNVIANDNMLLSRLDHPLPADLPETVARMMRGEALALRAYMYFDLTRLYNAAPAAGTETGCVPYKTDFGLAMGDRLTASQLLQRIMADIGEARTLLADTDPVKTGAALPGRYAAYDRSRRMNYYAATALLARVALWAGDYAAAAAAAREVMAAGQWRFVRADEVVATDDYGAEQGSDRLFAPETVMGLRTDNVLTLSRSTYEGLTGDFVKSAALYDESDVRRAWLFANPSAGGRINMIRYQRSTRQEDAARYGDSMVPLLRISEMWLIAAECALHGAGEPADAATLVASLLAARRAAPLPPHATDGEVAAAIAREYRRDFKGEGQLFYYYKRLGLTAIDDGTGSGNTIAMPQGAYQWPLPEYEKQFGYGGK